ncbi:ricin-type beta-trefoil lectin domain protein [Actinoplanes sp. N902-109]|uniref:ricin-type beta-trefoil lectin domain protein n=1 Tax=Actinoplanes sp. (strain N902-109) TaxID=649831 RepID=UPI0003294AFF|nr:ricin-type beta-trefoil lectin domain protein [Actinoplanes sp. N902-109]AGL19951.1 ricin b lectin [Actinoplanes sp. N902-109]
MIRIPKVVTAALVFASGVPVMSLATPASAAPPTASAANVVNRFDLDPGMLAAMRRDLGLSDDRIASRLATEAAAPVVQKRLAARLGTSFAGAWIAPGADRLTVAVTDRRQEATVRSEGAIPRLVTRSAADLTAARARLDHAATEQRNPAIHSWYVDVARNTVVVSAAPGAEAQARSFAEASGAGPVDVVTSAETPRTVYDIRGGDQYVINGNTLCSVGFPVAGGFVSAGHCGGVNSPTLGNNNVAQGTFAGSSFPGNDYSFIRTNGNWTPQPWVNNYAGGNVVVAGSQDAAIGSSICRSGRTTGWRCGTLQGREETVNYAQGAVSGLSRMSACAEPGDSGGSVISGNQAQGVTSGVTGNCTSGGTTWFQPVNEILGVYGLALTTSGGNGSTSAVVSDWNTKCIDVPNANFSDGVLVQMWTCNGTGAQRWTFVNGTLQTSNNKCLDIAWGSTANGAAVQIVGCSGNPAQQFVLSAAGDLVNPQANKCLDIKDWNGNDGALLQLWDCSGTANQKWHRA